jgi:hypothetical protein
MSSLSFSTWQIHALCIVDWLFAIECVWNFANYAKSKRLLLISSTLIFFLISGICILNWHYYNNTVELKWLITFQACFTAFANLTSMVVLNIKFTLPK